MAITKLRAELDVLVRNELNRANEIYPLFASDHEGYAVIKEELEEAREALEAVQDDLDILWQIVRGTGIPREEVNCEEMCDNAVSIAAEAIQTAAMILKYEISERARV